MNERDEARVKEILRFVCHELTLPLVIGTLIGASFMLTSTLAVVPTSDAPFVYTFNSPGILQEAGSMILSSSPYWWVNSGAKLIIQNGIGSTIKGSLPSSDPWRTLYNTSNPVDTDNGTHPQNIFRLVSKGQWENARIESMFRIKKDNFSASPNRNASNGLLLMSRYKSGGDTLYYAGLRVDGDAVIKKKYNGTYYTMAQKELFAGTYDRTTMPNTLPHSDWISLRLDTMTKADGTVSLTLYMRREGETVWKQILSATDTGTYGNSAPITGKGYAGMRTDFMDVEFDSFRVETLP